MIFRWNALSTSAAVIAALLVGGYFAWDGVRGPQPPAETDSLSLSGKTPQPNNANLSDPQKNGSDNAQQSREAKFSATLPKSLQYNTKPAQLDVDANGELIINVKIRNLFDYYLSAIGEETKQDLIARIENDLASLPPKAEARALEILDGYLMYKVAVDDYVTTLQNFSSPLSDTIIVEDLRRQEKEALVHKAHMRTIRSNYLDAETSEAFYGEEDRHDDYIEKLDEIRDNQNLSEDEKLDLKEKALSDMPEWFQKQEIIGIKQTRLKAMDRSSMTEAEYSAKRLEIVGPEAAARFEALDQEREIWNSRKASFFEARAELETFWGGTDNSGFEKALDKLKRDNFSDAELLRIQGQIELEAARRQRN